MGHTHHRSIMKAIAIFLSLVQASSLKRQDGNGYAATFPEQWTNVTGASQFSGSFDFLGVEGGVQVSASADNFPSGSLAKRQSVGQVNYAIYSGPATTGCRSVGSIIPGGDLSQQFGPLTEGAAVSYIAPDINADPNGGANSIAVGQRSVVASLLDGTIFACANIVLSSVPPNTVINVNININIDVTIVVCPICPPLTTVVYKAIYIPAPTHFYSFGNWYYCNTVGWYNILCPYTVHPGRTTTIASCPYITYTHAAYTTQTYTYNSPATTTRPTTVQTYTPTVISQVNSGSQVKYAGALVAVAGALALL